jgi:hypothetical protein
MEQEWRTDAHHAGGGIGHGREGGEQDVGHEGQIDRRAALRKPGGLRIRRRKALLAPSHGG